MPFEIRIKSKPISRVLSIVTYLVKPNSESLIISLGLQLLAGSITLPTRKEASNLLLPKQRPSLFEFSTHKVYPAALVTQNTGELLPHLFTLTSINQGGYFLRH